MRVSMDFINKLKWQVKIKGGDKMAVELIVGLICLIVVVVVISAFIYEVWWKSGKEEKVKYTEAGAVVSDDIEIVLPGGLKIIGVNCKGKYPHIQKILLNGVYFDMDGKQHNFNRFIIPEITDKENNEET